MRAQISRNVGRPAAQVDDDLAFQIAAAAAAREIVKMILGNRQSVAAEHRFRLDFFRQSGAHAQVGVLAQLKRRDFAVR